MFQLTTLMTNMNYLCNQWSNWSKFLHVNFKEFHVEERYLGSFERRLRTIAIDQNDFTDAGPSQSDYC